MSDGLYFLQGDCTCVRGAGGAGGTVQSGGAGLKTPPTIRFPVGLPSRAARCRNDRDDVKAIQRALNRFSPLEGGPNPKLVDDGFVGTKTDTAIGTFQSTWKIVSRQTNRPDHIVDPEQRTIQQLRLGPGAPEQLPQKFLNNIPQTLSIIGRSRLVLAAARSQLVLPVEGFPGFRQLALEKVERHFHVSQVGNPVARVDGIDRIFINMQTAIGFVPTGVVLALNEPAGIAAGHVMGTFAGGYENHRFDSVEFAGGTLSKGSIYLLPRAQDFDDESFVYIMIHELAHFCGPSAEHQPVNHITDHAYFDRQEVKYRALSADDAFCNADSYAQFAYDAIGRTFFRVRKLPARAL